MNPLRAILCKVLSVIIFIIMAAMVRVAMEEVPTGEAVFFRSVFALPVIIGWMAWTGHLHDGLKTKHPVSHIARGLVGTSAMAMSFFAYSILPLPEVTAILYAGPLMVVVLAAMFLGEEVRLFRIATVLLGLIGVLIVLSPNIGADAIERDAVMVLAAVVALGSALMAALAQVFVRSMVRTESTSAIVFYFTITSAALSLLTVPFGWVWPSPWVLTLLILCGLIGGVGQVLLTTAYRYGDASLVAPFDYSSMLVAILIGYVVFGDVPGLHTLIGGTVVILAGIAIILRERKLGLDRQRQRAARPPEG